MDDLGSFVDFPSPANSMYYAYGDSEPYLSESQSPNNSTYDPTSAGRSRYPSPGNEEGEPADPSDQQKPATAKRKRENRYKNAPPAVLSRRRAQNRASQRAYRERKDQRIKDLEQMLDDARLRHDVLGQAYAALQAEYVALKAQQEQHVNEGGYSQQQQSQGFGVTYGGGSGGGRGGDMGLGAATAVVEGGLDMDLFVYGGGGDVGVGVGGYTF